MDTGKSKKQNLSTNNIKSSILKMGAKTIFFDVNLAANDKKYLKITESRFTGEGFEKGLKEVVGYLN
ncbi:MAG: hypothetical protein UU53_C0014G0038 [Candidatus Curtissbacteria bacterium GW2011_GWC2_41_21]|nr:MAG: hypothetical protein UU53_C0014G0038 [Candidatus Curtissbacteria bacterium GW2011_GWC2_41_21]